MPAANLQSHVDAIEAPDLRRIPADALLTRRQVSALSGYALITLKRWSAQGRGPRITTVENQPRYRVEDVSNWLRGGR